MITVNDEEDYEETSQLVARTICEAQNGHWLNSDEYSKRMYLFVADAVIEALKTGKSPRE